MKYNEEEKNIFNDSNFQEEGEYLINQKPKYKYELKIIHDNQKPKFQIKAKTPDKIVTLPKFSIKDNSNIGYDEHYDNFNNCTFYKSRSTQKDSKISKGYSEELIPQPASQINIFSKTCQNFNQARRFKNNNYNVQYNNNEGNINDKKCICQKEFNKIISEYFGRAKNIRDNKFNHNKIINNLKNGRYEYDLNKKYSSKNINMEKNYNNEIYSKKYLENQTEIEESINKKYNPKKRDITPNNLRTSKINYFKNKDNKIYVENSSLTNNKKIYDKSINKNPHLNRNLFINYEKNIKYRDNNSSHNPYISIDDTGYQSFSAYNSNDISQNNKTPTKIQNDINNSSNIYNSTFSRTNNNNQLMIHKSSERKEKIKAIPLDQKINPIIIKKIVKKPVIEKIERRDGSIMNVIRQTSIVTSIETKPIMDLKKRNSNNEKLVKECITNIYTTLTKKVEDEYEDNIGKLSYNKSTDNLLNYRNKNKEKKGIFIKRKILNRNKFQGKNNIQKNFSNINNINNNKKNYNINISKISNDLLINKNNNNNSINNSSFNSNIYEQIDANNGRVIEEIKYIKYLYYRCTNLNSTNFEKSQTLSDYFLKLSDEDKIEILTTFNDGNPENKKIYKKLIDILKERRLQKENSKKSIYYRDNSEENKKKKINPSNILFKKKKIIK